MCKHFACPSLLGDGAPCQSDHSVPGLTYHLGHGTQCCLSQFPFPAYFQQGHSRTGITQTPWSPTCACPACVQSRDLSPLHRTFPAMHTHTCAHTPCLWQYPCTVHHTLGIQERPSQRMPWPEGALRLLQLFSLLAAMPPSAPTASWVPGTRKPCSCTGWVGGREVQREGEGVGAGL